MLSYYNLLINWANEGLPNDILSKILLILPPPLGSNNLLPNTDLPLGGGDDSAIGGAPADGGFDFSLSSFSITFGFFPLNFGGWVGGTLGWDFGFFNSSVIFGIDSDGGLLTVQLPRDEAGGTEKSLPLIGFEKIKQS